MNTLYELLSSLVQSEKILYAVEHTDLLQNPDLRSKIASIMINQIEINDLAGQLYASDYGIPYREEIAKETPTGNKLTLLRSQNE
jgi:hypothetical protein